MQFIASWTQRQEQIYHIYDVRTSADFIDAVGAGSAAHAARGAATWRRALVSRVVQPHVALGTPALTASLATQTPPFTANKRYYVGSSC